MPLLVPPLKSQGIKTKLIPWIRELLSRTRTAPRTWREPFLGTGVVPLNLPFRRYVLSDANPHIVRFYSALKDGEISSGSIRKFLATEGEHLWRKGEEHYYLVRDRFNRDHAPLDFLFLNRACFNGMIRFNKQGGFNVPFCRKPGRFSGAYITKIVNQSKRMEEFLQNNEVSLCCTDFREALNAAEEGDVLYCDPPYIDRYSDFYNSWEHQDEADLYRLLKMTKAGFLLSTWHHNSFRQNTCIDRYWKEFHIYQKEHFYHLGAAISNRNSMVEALVTNIAPVAVKCEAPARPKQHQLPLTFAAVQP